MHYYIRDLTVRDRQVRLSEINRKANENHCEYYHSGREDYNPTMIPVGSPFIVFSPGKELNLDSLDIDIIGDDLETYLKEAEVGDEVFKRDENPLLLAFVRGYNYTSREETKSPSGIKFSSSSLSVPYQFYLLEE